MRAPAFLLLPALALPLALPATAGTGYDFTCTGPDGEYTDQISLGGGRAFEQITGYCHATGKFVHLSWKRKEAPPRPLQVWDPRTGEILTLYQMPECPAPVAPIRDIQELRNIPPCKGKEFKQRRGVMYD